jgi:HAD superfamily hydrolase (TIGR01509 family)
MLKAIIFDMDGVLLDSERLWPEIEFERYRKLIPGWTMENHKLLTGLSLNDSYKLFTEKFGLDMSWEEYDGFYRTMAREVYLHRTSFYPGAREMLEELNALSIPIGLATSSPHYWLDLIFERFPLNDYFDVLLGADDVGGKGKPAPDIYEKAVEMMGFGAEECAAIEDSYNGVLAAHRAGMFPIGFRNGHNEETDFSDTGMEIEGFTPENRKRIIELVRGGV